MELTILLPIISELLKGEGSFAQKILIGVVFLVVIHLMGRNHIKLITTEMKSMKAEMVNGFNQINSQLHIGKEIHERHEQEIRAHDKQINSLQMDVQRIQSHNIPRNS